MSKIFLTRRRLTRLEQTWVKNFWSEQISTELYAYKPSSSSKKQLISHLFYFQTFAPRTSIYNKLLTEFELLYYLYCFRVVRFEYLYYEGYWMYPYNMLRDHGPSLYNDKKDFCKITFDSLNMFSNKCLIF